MSYGDGVRVAPEMLEAVRLAGKRDGRPQSELAMAMLACPWCWITILGRHGGPTRDPQQATRRFLVTPCILHGGGEDPLDPFCVQGFEPIPFFLLHPVQPPESGADGSWRLVAYARDFDGVGTWARLATGVWDLVVPVTVCGAPGRRLASYAGMRRPCRDPRE